MENPTQTGIYKKFTKGRGRPRQVQAEKAEAPIQGRILQNPTFENQDLIDVFLKRHWITADMHRACILYRTFYFQFCRLAFAPRLGQITYGEALGGKRKNAPYRFACNEREKDQPLEQRYLKLRQRITQDNPLASKLFHQWLLYSNNGTHTPFNPEDLQIFKSVCHLLVKEFKA